ncbi:MAG: DNA topoisomerase VI subunit B [Nitrospiraceae bacterium]|nr:DNA topoisomerase VI subunit B [Nitrospiraceae bacterium]
MQLEENQTTLDSINSKKDSEKKSNPLSDDSTESVNTINDTHPTSPNNPNDSTTPTDSNDSIDSTNSTDLTDSINSAKTLEKRETLKDEKATKQNKKSKVESKERTAEYFATKQRAISIAEFFEKNRHLLGFDSKRKALLTAVKEAVDNSLDACEEARILPDIKVSIIQLANERYKIIIEDNGPGIVKEQVPKIFAKLLYGSKFNSMKQTRGQQGIGISAAALYGQLTTGKPIKITSKISSQPQAHYFELYLNTTKNEPKIVKQYFLDTKKEHGTKIEIELEASYYQGSQSVDEYIKQIAIVNPHANITYVNPKSEYTVYARASNKLPIEPKPIKPHPYGIEVGTLTNMLAKTSSKTVLSFLKSEFSRVSTKIAEEILSKASVLPSEDPHKIGLEEARRIIKAIKSVKIMAPPTNCLSPIQEDQLEIGLKKEVNAEFYATITRPPSVYRGNPFIIEAAFAYGGLLHKDEIVKVLRFANKVPLLYQAGACALTKSVIATNWKRYGLSQSKGSLPIGPLVILIHIASVWVPYTNEAKEAIANYDEIIKEVKLAFQELGRKLYKYIRKKTVVKDELNKRSYITKFIPHIAVALKEILGFDDEETKKIELNLSKILEKKRGAIENIEFDATKNTEYDEKMKLNIKGGIVDDYIEDTLAETDNSKDSRNSKNQQKNKENQESKEKNESKETEDNIGKNNESTKLNESNQSNNSNKNTSHEDSHENKSNNARSSEVHNNEYAERTSKQVDSIEDYFKTKSKGPKKSTSEGLSNDTDDSDDSQNSRDSKDSHNSDDSEDSENLLDDKS